MSVNGIPLMFFMSMCSANAMHCCVWPRAGVSLSMQLKFFLVEYFVINENWYFGSLKWVPLKAISILLFKEEG